MSELEPRPLGFHVMAKPSGSLCNLDCKYCFYLEKEKLYPGNHKWAMPDDVLEAFIRQYIESQNTPVVTFAWQGGEPTVLGLEFFQKVVRLQKQFAGIKTVNNTFQTNAVLVDDAWAAFFAEHGFLVGVSIDGPRAFHDHYRVDKGGRPTFDKVMRGIDCLNRHGAEFNTLTCVQRHNADHAVEVYRFLRDAGSGFLQFIPIVERQARAAGEEDLVLVSPDYEERAAVTPWSVKPDQWGSFLCGVFDEWVRRDVGETFVQLFDITLGAWVGQEPALCIFRQTCGDAMAIEHNGDLYSCDHYVYPANRLGNLMETPIAEMAASVKQRAFGQAKRDTLTPYCRACPYLFACNGDCPKHRFVKTPQGDDGLSYLCAGYKAYFAHTAPAMQFMAAELRQQRPASNVMAWVARQDLATAGNAAPGPNDRCPCGSGKKFKKCCARGA